MLKNDREIKTVDYKIDDLVKMLREDKFLVPTFQREFVWEPANILKLWDSIYKFYPMGSILYWETDSYLHTHRRLGGFVLPHDEDSVRRFKEWCYILDGQQRATSLLVSLLGGKGRVQDDPQFDFTLFFDATKGQFFFASEFDKRKKTTDERFLIRVRDVPSWPFTFYRDIAATPGFDKAMEERLGQLQRVFTHYAIPVVKIKGVEVNEVCDIFERINQEGKRLDPVDIMVARTYRNEDPVSGRAGFYLRDNLEGLRNILVQNGSRFQELDDLTIMQMVALCLRKGSKEQRNPFGITPTALDNLTTDNLETNWDACQRTILETIKFLGDLKIQGPGMLPYVYLALPICYYLHKNRAPNRDMARQWFWRSAFDAEDFRTSTQVYQGCEKFFAPLERGAPVALPPLSISRNRLLQTSYNYRNALSRAVLSLLANQEPLDFEDPRAVVLDNVYLLLSQAPNLHHIYPQNFLRGIPLSAGVDPDSLLNICFIRAATNIRIGDANPLSYFRSFSGKVRGFGKILQSHLIPLEFTEQSEFQPEDYRSFLRARADLLIEKLKQELPDVQVTVSD